MKWILIIAGAFLVVLLGIGVVKALQGEHVKIFGIEFNSSKPKPDTVVNTVFVPDTTKNKPQVDIKKQPIIVLPPKEKKIETVKDTTPTIKGKNINTGTNNGIIGDNATVNAPIQPHPDRGHVIEFLSKHPDKNAAIKFYYRSDSKMSNTFANELIDLLKKEGYKNVGAIIDLANSMKNSTNGIIRMKDKDSLIRYFVQVDN